MNNFNMNDSRNRRNLLNWSGFFPFQSVTNYSTNTTKMKIDMKNSFGDALYINNLHLIPDPLKKNLADSFITEEVKSKTNMASENHFRPNLKENNSSDHQTDSYPPLGIITSFISGVLSFVSGGMFHKRTNTPTQYYECYDQNFDESVPSLQAWQLAKPEDQNKNGRALNNTHSTNVSSKTTDGLTVNSNNKTSLHCNNELNQVCLLLSNQSSTQCQSQQKNCQQNVLNESNTVEDCFEDAFTPEDFESLPDVSCLEFYGPFSHLNPDSIVSDAPRMRTECMPLIEHMEIVNTLPNIVTNKETNVIIPVKDDLDESIGSKARIVVSSCEDKMNKLKALLQNCHKNNIKIENNTNTIQESLKNNKLKTEPILIPNSINLNSAVENVFKEHSTEEGISPRELVSEDIVKDINTELQTSFTDSQCSNTTSEHLDPCNYFDEVTGRFYSTSADSEDSFQIVFDDSPKSHRARISSECESEDSFIIFDDTPDSCYSSNDIFGDELNVTGYDFIGSSDSEISDDSDSDSDSESDSGCDTYNFTCKLSHSLTRTIGDLTDDSLYNMDKDEVDCAARFVEDKTDEVTSGVLNVDNTSEKDTKPKGLLIDAKRKLEKKKQPTKTVRFSPNPPKVHVMRVWAFAARQARAGHWERHALDRERFKRRIADVDMAVSWVLKPQHRARVMFQRFMPWWNAQRRKELAEKKQQEEEEKTVDVKEISRNLPDVKYNSESSVNDTNIGNDIPYQAIDENKQNADIGNKSPTHEVKTENLATSNGKILSDDIKINGLKSGIQNNNVDLSI